MVFSLKAMRRQRAGASQAMMLCVCVVMASTSAGYAQSTSVELIGTTTAQQAANGLGFNLDAGQDWEWAALAASGATHARFQCSWALVEKQTPPPENRPATPQFLEDPPCTRGFVSARRYGMHPTVVAGYGPPNHSILSVTIPEGAPAGATKLSVQLEAGIAGKTLANLSVPYDYICPLQANVSGAALAHTRCASQFSRTHSYQGTLISDIRRLDANHAVLTLASALTSALPVGPSHYVINEILYPSTISFLPTDPSVAAYANYVGFLAQDMASFGVTGDIELWNEPPWAPDPWANRCNLYDAALSPCPPYPKAAVGQMYANAPNYGFAIKLQDRQLPPGITLTWAGTNLGSNPSLLGPNVRRATGASFKQPPTVITAEAYHPYGGPFGNPEDAMGTMECLGNYARKGVSPVSTPGCYLPGERNSQNGGSNLFGGVALDVSAKMKDPSLGLGRSITETTLGPIPVTSVEIGVAQQVAQARFNLRQYLGFQAMGITPIEFFKLWDGQRPKAGAATASFVDYDGSRWTPLAGYTALAGLMADLKPVSQAPARGTASQALLAVSRYQGTYPLTTVHLIGLRSHAAADSDMLVVWQRSTCATHDCWNTLPSPPPGSITVRIPSGMQITAVRDLVTRADLHHTFSGGQCNFSVADNPIEILADPAGGAAQ